jgi:hypothetical protein
MTRTKCVRRGWSDSLAKRRRLACALLDVADRDQAS